MVSVPLLASPAPPRSEWLYRAETVLPAIQVLDELGDAASVEELRLLLRIDALVVSVI